VSASPSAVESAASSMESASSMETATTMESATSAETTAAESAGAAKSADAPAAHMVRMRNGPGGATIGGVGGWYPSPKCRG
jgi:hypothetical protein